MCLIRYLEVNMIRPVGKPVKRLDQRFLGNSLSWRFDRFSAKLVGRSNTHVFHSEVGVSPCQRSSPIPIFISSLSTNLNEVGHLRVQHLVTFSQLNNRIHFHCASRVTRHPTLSTFIFFGTEMTFCVRPGFNPQLTFFGGTV